MVISIARGPIRWMLRWRGFSGVTLPPFGIFIIEERLSDEFLIKHEQAHWKQYQQMGFFMFYIKYLWYSFRYGYWNNPMEVEARKAEQQL